MKRLIVALMLAAVGTISPASAAPSNDGFADAIELSSVPSQVTADLTGATRQTGEPVDCGSVRRSVWYSFTVAQPTDVRFRVSGATGQKSVAVYTGALGMLTRKGCGAGSGTQTSSVTVAPGQVVIQIGVGLDGPSSLTLALEPLYRISGTVTADGGGPLGGICVASFSSPYRSTTTLVDGTYSLALLTPGTYRLRFTSCTDGKYIEEWYDNQATTGTPIVITDASVGGIDVSMARGSRIIGTLTDRRGGPATGACVYAWNGPNYVSVGYTNGAGQYWLDIDPGTYTLQLSACTSYMTEWHNDEATQALATPVDVTAGTDTIIDAELEPGGVIKGQVLDMHGDPVSSECVEIFDETSSSTPIRFVLTDPQGRYQARALPTGSYRMRIGGCFYWAKSITEWYPDATSYEASTPIPVTFGQETVANVTVSSGAFISGTVADDEGFPFSQACVSLYSAGGEALRTIYADTQGAYKASLLPDGTYKIRFGCSSRDFTQSWYGGTDFASATPVTTTDASPASGINGQLALRQAPSNDTFADAAVVGSLPYSDVRDITKATRGADEPGFCGSAPLFNSVWYRYASSDVRVVTASTRGTVDVDTVIGVYTQGPTGLIEVACKNDYKGLNLGETVDFLALPGVEMFIQVAKPNVATYDASLIRFSLS